MIGRINFWRLEGDDLHSHLVSLVLNEKTIDNTIITIVLDFSSPWNLVESLTKWLRISCESIEKALKNLPVEHKQQMQQRSKISFFLFFFIQSKSKNLMEIMKKSKREIIF